MPVITISREMGTGAYQIATEVAKKLKFTLVDGACINACAPKYGLSPDMLQMVDEKPPSYITAEDRKRAAALNTIELMLLDFARKGNVILYGRGGQDLLKGCNNVLRLRFIADFEERVERFAEREWIDPDLAQSMIRRSDHQRGGFIHFYFDRAWNDPLGYDMTFNTSRLSPTSIVESIVAAARDPFLKDAEKAAVEQIDNTILEKKIETALLNSPDLDYRPFKIEVEKGCAVLSGYLACEEEKKNAIRIAESIKGIKTVKEDIHIVNYKAYRDKS
ncbi:cytidylate kinase family protein [Geobacter sp. SVR]|uniref:cytidylate kinase family protein n=1 Tax=Geobacter sp. SVR TaxID=2495594 RepID=UPI00143F04CB|nr:cytidylate kinase family protein [Geobacter sp. SVR]BCS53036.1 transporter [Geobacter sp. SVR]GCF84421.1 transporter [Geobacter sp. SVR]